MRSERTNNIFQGYDLRCSATFVELAHYRHEGVESTATVTLQPSTTTGERQILTRKRTPDQVRHSRQISKTHISNIIDDQMVGTPILGIRAALFRIEVVRKFAGPTCSQTGTDHPSASEKLKKSWQCPNLNFCSCKAHSIGCANIFWCMKDDMFLICSSRTQKSI